MKVTASHLPPSALLVRYREQGDYTDCYSAQLAQAVSLADFVTAFYTTRLFKLERLILKRLLSLPSSDEDAAAVAQGSADAFAAWTVEARNSHQLLMCDVHQRTRSWFMVSAPGADQTRLWFGSAVVRNHDPDTGKPRLGPGYSALMGFHKLYSRALLHSAVRRLQRQSKPGADRSD